MKNDIQIKSSSITDDGEVLHLHVVVHNPAARTRHLYASFRALRYDDTTKTLEVQLSDEGLVEPRSLRGTGPVDQTTFVLPHFTAVDGNADKEIDLRIPRTIMRVSPEKSTAESLKFDILPAYEATTVKITIAWSDTPFYHDPRRPYENRAQLVEWSKGIITHEHQRSEKEIKR